MAGNKEAGETVSKVGTTLRGDLLVILSCSVALENLTVAFLLAASFVLQTCSGIINRVHATFLHPRIREDKKLEVS